MTGDIPFSGDWNGDGKADVAVSRNGVMYLDANGNHRWDNAVGGDIRMGFGLAGDLPVSGIWKAPGPMNPPPMSMTLVSSNESTGNRSESAVPLSSMVAVAATETTSGNSIDATAGRSSTNGATKSVPHTPLTDVERELRDQVFAECGLSGVLG